MKNPNAFQGTKRKKNYFEGWYLKHQKGDHKGAVMVFFLEGRGFLRIGTEVSCSPGYGKRRGAGKHFF